MYGDKHMPLNLPVKRVSQPLSQEGYRGMSGATNDNWLRTITFGHESLEVLRNQLCERISVILEVFQLEPPFEWWPLTAWDRKSSHFWTLLWGHFWLWCQTPNALKFTQFVLLIMIYRSVLWLPKLMHSNDFYGAWFPKVDQGRSARLYSQREIMHRKNRWTASIFIIKVPNDKI